MINLKDNENIFIARTLRMMNYLVMDGNPCFKVEDDEHNPKYKVFLFDVTDKLNESIRNYNKLYGKGEYAIKED